MKKLLALLLSVLLIATACSVIVYADNVNVAKVGSTEYATIDEAIANWTNGTTLTLLADVTLSDVIQLSSTEYHILDLGTYTMTAASGKDAIQYVVNGRTSAGYALDIKADATNPGGITATGTSVVRHTKPTSNAPDKDRPITRFYGGVFNATYVVRQGGTWGSGYTGSKAPYFYFYGGEFNGTIYTNRSQNQFHGGVFNGQLQISVDSSAYTLITGGKFKYLSNMMGSNLDEKIAQGKDYYKFTIGTSKSVYDKAVYVDDEGYYVVADSKPTEEIEAGVAMTPGGDDYFYYSEVATEGALNYTDVYMALEKNKTATVTVYTDELDLTGSSFTGTIVVPEGQTLTVINPPEGVTFEGDVTIVEPVAQIGDTQYNTLKEAIAALKDGDTLVISSKTISEGAIKLPANLIGVTIKGSEGTVLKDMTISAADGNSYSYVGLTFDGITFDNSRLLFTGWRNDEEIIEDFTVTNCTFKNLNDDTNTAPIHVNKDISEPVRNFTFTNNIIDGAIGGSKSGIYLQATGNVIITDNTFNNIVFRPALVQLADCDGVADEVVISNNVISNTTRLQILGSEADNGDGTWTPNGTDTLSMAINDNIFQNITGYYICTWGINGETDISENYYDGEISGKIYWNNEKPTDEAGLNEIGIYPYYTALTEDGTIDPASKVEYVAAPTGSNSPAYTKEVDGYVRVWGEGGGNAKESFVLKLYSGETILATTTLNNIGGIINGDVYVTWNFYYPSSNDEYWTTTWEEGHPNSAAQPTKVELWIDGACVATTPAKMSGADDINPVIWEELGGVKYIVTGLQGLGTQEDPFLINNKEELLWFQAKVDEQASDGSTQFAGAYFKLTADIDLAGINWNPIGSMTGDHGSFKGIFDGDGHTIFNLYVEQAGNGLGLFARTAGNAVIKNLNLVNVTVKSTDNSNYLGAVVGNSYASTKIENVHVSGDILISGRGYIGGISGHGYVVMDDVSVVGNEGSLITSTFWCAGGILGYGGEGATNITNAHVEGLTITSAAGGLGAIVGMAEDNNGTQPISGSNLSAKDVEIKTYVGGYGTAYEDYAMGYLYGGNPTSKLTGTLTVDNVTVETASGNPASVNDAVASVNGTIYFDIKAAFSAAQNGDTIALLRDVVISESIYVNGKTLTFDGNGHTISQASGMTLGNYLVPLRFNNGDYIIKNVVFDGWTSKSVLRIEGSSAVVDNVTIKNTNWSTDTQATSYGVLYIENSEVTVKNSEFLNNVAGSTITYGYGSSKDMSTKLVIDNCLFEGNVSNGDCSIVYYVKGTGCTITNSKFIGNEVNCNTNGATIYLGFMDNCVVTNNLFKDNVVTDSSNSTRVAGAIFAGYQATITGNAFDNNTASNANGDVLGQVCISTYYNEGYVDLNDNYWNGGAPVYGTDYTIQHQTGGGDFGMDSYYTEYELDADGNVVLSGEAANIFVAKIGTKKYTSLQAAINAAKNGDTVVLVADVVLTDMLTIPADLTVTLDLNGKTISQTKEQTAGYQMILNDGNLTINDSVGGGKISYTDSGNGGEYISDTIYNRGNLVINGGTIENLSSATVAANGYPHAVDTYSGLRDTSVTINGGTIYCASYSAIRMFCVSATYKADLVINDGTIRGAVDMQNGTKNAANGTLTINGGTFEKNASRANVRFANWNGGATEYGVTATVTGGTFDAGFHAAYVPAAANWNNKIVTGGTFGEDVSDFCAVGFTCEENSEGTYSVILIYGDVNLDGVVNILDYVALAKAVNREAEANEDAADLNLNGDIEANDLVILKKLLLGLTVTRPVI